MMLDDRLLPLGGKLGDVLVKKDNMYGMCWISPKHLLTENTEHGLVFCEDVRRMLNRQKAIQDKQLWLVASGLATGLVGLAFWVVVKK